MQLTSEMIRQFDVAGPRYTSYPTAPQWHTDFTDVQYIRALHDISSRDGALSLYVHVPFCTSMCYYCGCNVTIRKQDSTVVGDHFLDYLEKEVDLVVSALGRRMSVRQFHIGGGTPNFLTAAQLDRLVMYLKKMFLFEPGIEQAIEIDPRRVTPDMPEALANLGFNRVSMGIQDFDATVQSAINRIQPYQSVSALFVALRNAGISGINADLIYGLPHQTVSQFMGTIDLIHQLKPDRIALYSYAHVPWLKSHQRLIPVAALPNPTDKLAIFLAAREALVAGGYVAIGMDHFARDADAMAHAYVEGTLYRNFMGYTLKPADDYIGFGPSAIGHVGHAFSQNSKELKLYYASLDADRLPVDRGMQLTLDDQIREWVIQSLMCRFRVDKDAFLSSFGVSCDMYFHAEMAHVGKCVAQGLLQVSEEAWIVTDLGRVFVRNICLGFDAYFIPQTEARYSRTV